MLRALRLLGLAVFAVSLVALIVIFVLDSPRLEKMPRLLFCLAFMLTGASLLPFPVARHPALKYSFASVLFILGLGLLFCATTAILGPSLMSDVLSWIFAADIQPTKDAVRLEQDIRDDWAFPFIALGLSLWSNVRCVLEGPGTPQ